VEVCSKLSPSKSQILLPKNDISFWGKQKKMRKIHWQKLIMHCAILFVAAFSTPDKAIGVVIPITKTGGHQVALPEGQVRIQFWMGIWSDLGNNERGLFPNLILTTSDVGRIFTVNENNNPYFNEYIQFITDRIDGMVGYGHSFPDAIQGVPGVSGSYIGLSESHFFLGMAPNGIDLQGYLIDSATLSINSLIFDVPGRNPNGDGYWIDYEIDMSLSFVPEPATVCLLGFGALGLLRKRRA
jgi:hypothetical protein